MKKNEIIKFLKFLHISGIYEFIADSPKVYFTKDNQEKLADISNYKKSKSLDLTNINTLDELKKYIENFNKCELKKNAINTVFSDGNPKSKIMFIGEAPGADEDKQGIPFVGKAGQLLNKMITAINLDRKNIYISNIVPWRPPGNRQPTTKETMLCLPFIQKHIEIINPEMLVLLGGTATKALLVSDEGIMRLRGKWHEYNSYGLASPILTRAIFHPAFLLRSPGYKKLAWEDLLEIKKELNI